MHAGRSVPASSHVDARAGERAARRRDARCRASTAARAVVGDERRAVDAGRVQRTFEQHRALGEPDRARRASTSADRRRATLAQSPTLGEVVGPRDRRDERGERRRRRVRARRTVAVVAPRPPRRSAGASARGARRPRASTRRAPARPVRVGELAGRGRRPATPTLPPNAPPLASGVAGSPPGAHHDASGSRYAGSTQPVASRTPPGTGAGQRERRHGIDGRAPTLHLARERRAPRAATRRRPSRMPAASTPAPSSRAGAGPRPARRGARRRRRTRRRRAARRRPTRWRRAALELGPSRRRRRDRASVGRRALGRAVDRLVDGLPAGAPAQVRGERAVEVDASGLAPRLARPRPARGSRACRTRTASRRSPRSAPRARRAPRRRARRRSSPPGRRRASPGVTHATRGSPSTSTVQHPHWPCGAHPSFTESTPSRSRSTESSDSPGAASTSTCSPSHENCTRCPVPVTAQAG